MAPGYSSHRDHHAYPVTEAVSLALETELPKRDRLRSGREGTRDKKSSFPTSPPCEFGQVTPHLGPILSQEERGVPKHRAGDKLQQNPTERAVQCADSWAPPPRLAEPVSLGGVPQERDPAKARFLESLGLNTRPKGPSRATCLFLQGPSTLALAVTRARRPC